MGIEEEANRRNAKLMKKELKGMQYLFHKRLHGNAFK